jgi:hypothetical protein
LLADATPALAKKCKYPGCGGSTMLRSRAVPQSLLQQFAYYDPRTKSLRLRRYAKGRPPFNNASPKTATRYPGHFSDPQDAAAEAHLEERLAREFDHPVTGHRPHRTVTISGNHPPLPMIVNVTHESLETGMVDLIMFQEVL